MKKYRKIIIPSSESITTNVNISNIDFNIKGEVPKNKILRERGTYLLNNGLTTLLLNNLHNGRFVLLSDYVDVLALQFVGVKTVNAEIFDFSEKESKLFSLCWELKNKKLSTIDTAYLMKKLIDEFSITQSDLSIITGKSRPAIANTLRLLNLSPQVIGLIESGKLSPGHARTLVSVPDDKQLIFAQECIRRKLSVREMERAVKSFLIPPEILKARKELQESEKTEELKLLVDKMRRIFCTQVSLIGNCKKGRIYIDYFSSEDLNRIKDIITKIDEDNNKCI